MQKPQTSDTFWLRVNKNGKLLSDCWEWTGYRIPQGYGQVGWGGKVLLAHRVAYELTFGPIPEGKEIHHTCENRACCNPYHLRTVVHTENMKLARRSHCRYGHERTPENTYLTPKGVRQCRACNRRRVNKHAAQKRLSQP